MLPRLLMPASLALPPVEYCFGTSPIHAANSRPLWKAAPLPIAATIAVAGEVPLSRLWHAVPSYPTISEVWLRLLETYGL